MYRKNLQGWSKHLDFMILDLISLQAAFVIAYMIRFGFVELWNPYLDGIYRNMAIVIALIDKLNLSYTLAKMRVFDEKKL